VAVDGEDLRAICTNFERLLGDSFDEVRLRQVMETQEGYCRKLWRSIADLGLTGLLIEPRFGGTSAGCVALERLMEHSGAALLLGPFLSSAVVSSALLSRLPDEACRQRLLAPMAAGDLIVTSALTDETGQWTEESISVCARESEGVWALNGVASFVMDAEIADVIITAAIVDSTIALLEVPRAATGLTVDQLTTWDPTLRLSKISYSHVQAKRCNGGDWKSCRDAIDVARLALAGHQAGAARRIFEIVIDYLKTRVQFGRPIGSFQAMKHMAADLLIDVESATSAARAAARAYDLSSPQCTERIHLAAFVSAEAFRNVAATSIQMHGGIAYTWEHVAHLYLRRARATAYLFGSPEFHREQFLSALERPA
jgi:alkylation response protein AidB-like acyl-CoA dehydrogenase